MGTQKVKKGDYIQMIASMSGLDFSYAPDQALRVGEHIDVDLANKLLEPADDPRARVIDKETGERLIATPEISEATEVPQRSQAQAVEERAAESPLGDAPAGHEGTPGPPGEDSEPDPEEELGDMGHRLAREDNPDEGHGIVPDAMEDAAAAESADEEVEGEHEAGNDEEEEDVEEGEQRTLPEGEQATSPDAEKRETATQKRRRARVKPPKEEEEKES